MSGRRDDLEEKKPVGSDEDNLDGEEEYEDYEDEPRGILSTALGKIIVGLIILLAVIVIALAAVNLIRRNQTVPSEAEATEAPAAEEVPVSFLPEGETETEEEESSDTTSNGSIQIRPEMVATPTPTAEPTEEPTPTPAPTATPTPSPTPEEELPVILTGTPTPSPSPTPTPTPSPTPEVTPTPSPSPTPQANIGTGVVKKSNANLRATAATNGKVLKKIKKGETVTIHEMITDDKNAVWYAVTVDDLAAFGYMRDYVIAVDGSLTTEEPENAEAQGEVSASEAAEAAAEEQAPACTGKTNRDSVNLRASVGGKAVSQLHKNTAVNIKSVRKDKKGNVWYEVEVQKTGKTGYVRDYCITLDEGSVLPEAETTPEPSQTAEPAEEKTETAASEAAGEATTESVLDREVIGHAITNRDANVRRSPASGSKLVRTLSKGNNLLVLDMYKNGNDIWYEVCTESGKTHGFVRDYVIYVITIQDGVEAKEYVKQ